MASVYTRALGTLVWSDAATHQVFVVPDGQTYIVRDLVLVSFAASAQLVDLYIGSPVFVHLFTGELQPQVSVHVDMRQAMVQGETLQAASLGLGQVTLAVTGYVFLL